MMMSVSSSVQLGG